MSATAAFVERWVPVTRHHNLKRLAEEARSIIPELRAIGEQLLDTEVFYTNVETPGAPTREEARRGNEGLLGVLRHWVRVIEHADRRILPGLARHFRHLAAEYVLARDAARRRIAALRAFLALVEHESDDEQEGITFVPPPPAIGGPASSVPLSEVLPLPRSDFEIHCSEAALAQLAEIQAYALARPGGPHALFWNALERILTSVSSGEPFDPDADYSGDGSAFALSRCTLGKANVFFVVSRQQKRVVVLLLAQWNIDSAPDAVARIEERLRSAEWDPIFDDLRSYARLTDQGRTSMCAVLRGAVDNGDADSGRLLARIERANAHEPVYVEDLRVQFDQATELAEEYLDNALADRALASERRVDWDSAKADLDD